MLRALRLGTRARSGVRAWGDEGKTCAACQAELVRRSQFPMFSTERTHGERAFVSRSLDMDMKPALASVGSQFIKDGDLTLPNTYKTKLSIR